MTPVRVLVVDDQALLVDAFRLLLGSQEDLEVVATASDGAAALDRLRERPGGVDVVLMDVRMPVMDGITALRRMQEDPALTAVPVLVLTTFDDEELVLGALRAGARGFLLKDADTPVLLAATRTVAAGGSWLDPAVTGTVLAHLGDAPTDADAGKPDSPSSPAGSPAAAGEASATPAATPDGSGPVPIAPAASPLLEPLTGRETDVLALVCEGLSNAEIGERLYLAESTVKTHVKAVLGKTGCRNRVELIVHAFRTGLVRPS